MSIERLAESVDVTKPFPGGKNVRVLITGLALCGFTPALSTFRFLRHVPNHELLMRITQMRTNMTDKKTIVVKLDPNQNVEISGTTPTTLGSHIYPTSDPNEDFNHLVKMKSGLHSGRPLSDKSTMPSPPPTFLKLNHCAFYTYKKTENEFYFDDEIGTRLPNTRYCQILGGYMNYSTNLTISIENNGIPFNFSTTGLLYEIEFSNSCDTTPTCKDQEDFQYMYDIVEQPDNPGRKFKLKKVVQEAIGTGACLPACEGC